MSKQNNPVKKRELMALFFTGYLKVQLKTFKLGYF